MRGPRRLGEELAPEATCDEAKGRQEQRLLQVEEKP